MLSGVLILGLSLVLFQANYGLLCRLAEDLNTIYDFCSMNKYIPSSWWDWRLVCVCVPVRVRRTRGWVLRTCIALKSFMNWKSWESRLLKNNLGICDQKTPLFPRWVSIVPIYCVHVDRTLSYALLTLTMSVLQRLAFVFEAISSFYWRRKILP